MASLQRRGDSWRVYFQYNGEQHAFTLGEVTAAAASVAKAQTEELLRLLKRNLIDVPAGCSIEQFMFHGGQPPAQLPIVHKQITFGELRDAYLKTFSNGAIEENTLYTAKIHLAHLAGTLGENFVMDNLTLANLQKHVNQRQKKVAAVTIRKEIDTLRSVWRWAARMDHVQGEFPNGGLVYPKSQDKLPFMTWTEIDRRLAAGGDPEELWEALYLTEPEIEAFLDFIQSRKAPAWVYPMCVMAGHTGARRSEMMRAERQDVDFETGIITIREKKKARGRLTTRRVPMSTRLKEALRSLPALDSRLLFGKHSVQAVQHAFMRVVGKHASNAKNAKTKARKEAKRRTKWSVIRGYHVLRHSMISVLAARGIDQRIINELAGHTTEAMAQRYRHLIPDLKASAIKTVFG